MKTLRERYGMSDECETSELYISTEAGLSRVLYGFEIVTENIPNFKKINIYIYIRFYFILFYFCCCCKYWNWRRIINKIYLRMRVITNL